MGSKNIRVSDINAVVRRLLSVPKAAFMEAPTAEVLRDLRVVAEHHAELSPIARADLMKKLALDRVDTLPPAHLRVFNTTRQSVVETITFLPPNSAIETFNALYKLQPLSGISALAVLQEKWFSSWKPSSLSKTTRGPKLKSGCESHDASALRGHSFTRAVDTKSLVEAVANVDRLRDDTNQYECIETICESLRDELQSRSYTSPVH